MSITETPKPLQVTEENAPRVLEWLRTRGGVYFWRSQDLEDPGAGVITPMRDNNGVVNKAPHWKYGGTPERHITRAEDVEVCIDEPVETFDVKLKCSGHRVVLQKASQRKVEAALARAGDYGYLVFGERAEGLGRLYNALQYGCDTCTIMLCVRTMPLLAWEELETWKD